MKMTSIGKLALAFTAAATLALPAVADAATYVSKLEYRDGLVGPQTPYGLVTLEEINATTVKVTVTLTDAASLFINTGGPHDPFLFNTVNNDTVVVQSPIDTFYNAGRGTFNATPFGNFTNKIGCCNDKNGQSKGETPPLIFTVSNASGLTFAGLGATFDGTGKLVNQGTGDHFTSNAYKYWFSADIYDGATGKTYNVAAKDAFVQTTVPEPATWAMMIMGFGAAGAVLRRRRQMAAA